MDKSFQSLNNSYEAVQHRSQSPAITQLIRKDQQIEAMRYELSQQNTIIDELVDQIKLLEQQLNENEDYREKYHSAMSQQQQYSFEKCPKIVVPIQQTIIQDSFEQEPSKVEVQVLQVSAFYKEQLAEALLREQHLQEAIDSLLGRCKQMNAAILKNNQAIEQAFSAKKEELESQLLEKEQELTFLKDKCHALVDLLGYNGEIMLQYQKVLQAQNQIIKANQKLIVEQSQQIDQSYKFIDQQLSKFSSVDFKNIFSYLQSPIVKNVQVLQELESHLQTVEGKSVVEKVRLTLKKNKHLQKLTNSIESEKENIVSEIQYYKSKLQEQDETIRELEQVLTEMEAFQKSQMEKQELHFQELYEKEQLLENYKILLEQYKQSLNKNESFNQDLNDSLDLSCDFEQLLKYVLQVVSGYDAENNSYFLNAEQGIQAPHAPVIKNPVHRNIVCKIEQQVGKLYKFTIRVLHEVCSNIIGSITYIEQQLPDQILKVQGQNFVDDKNLESIERFFELSYEYVVNHMNLSTADRDQYMRYYPYISRFHGEVLERQTTTFVRLLREKVYGNLIYDIYPSKQSRLKL